MLSFLFTLPSSLILLLLFVFSFSSHLAAFCLSLIRAPSLPATELQGHQLPSNRQHLSPFFPSPLASFLFSPSSLLILFCACCLSLLSHAAFVSGLLPFLLLSFRVTACPSTASRGRLILPATSAQPGTIVRRSSGISPPCPNLSKVGRIKGNH